jgi:hypothetical protein
VYLTKLRIDAIALIHSRLLASPPSPSSPPPPLVLPPEEGESYRFAREAFEVWRDGWHEACGRWMAEDAEACLEGIKRR